MDIIEVDMFPEEVNSEDHPDAVKFRQALEEAAEEHNCSLLSFEVNEGTVSFAFDNDVLTAKILEILQIEQPTE